jgi:hypothetical protein
MRLNRLLTRSACLAATLALCACASSSSASSSASSSVTATRASCQYRSDSVVAEKPVVEIQPPGSTAQPIGTQKSLPLACGTTLTVRSEFGAVQATFGTQGSCQLTQYQNQPASLVSRTPAVDLLTFQSGDLACTVNGPVVLPLDVVKCPYGEVEARQAQYFDLCADPVFIVGVRLGSVNIIGPNGITQEVEAGAEFAFNFSSGAFRRASLAIPAVDLPAFLLQATEMHLK